MRLINAETLKLQEIVDTNIPPYAILSHTWGPAGSEITFQDIQNLSPELRDCQGYAKISNCCAQALRNGLAWVWVDTCCIDKSSSAELSESINSMFDYYKKADMCYAYLADIDVSIEPSTSPVDGAVLTCFKQSKWFTRGWTLQELLAPRNLEFYSQNWISIGTKATLSGVISEITRIPIRILGGGSLFSVSVATRMSWASNRVTTRLEDVAYSLLGIFDVHMPLLYGEGDKAFTRLQEQIMRESDDQSLFAWENISEPTFTRWASEIPKGGLLAESPAAFARTANIIPFRNMKASEPYNLTNKGIKMNLILVPYQGDPVSEPLVTAVLECRLDGPFEGLLGITLIRSSKGSDQYARYLGESGDVKTIGVDKILGQKPTTVFVRKSVIAPDFSLTGRFVIRVSLDSGYKFTQAYPQDCWSERASIMGTNEQGIGLLIFERPRDRHFVVLLRNLASVGYAESEVCKLFRERQPLRQALKPYYGVYEHLTVTCAHKTEGPLKEGDAISNSIGSLMGRRNVFSGLMDNPHQAKVSCRSGDVFGQQMFIIDVA